jgi:hypothetical protein
MWLDDSQSSDRLLFFMSILYGVYEKLAYYKQAGLYTLLYQGTANPLKCLCKIIENGFLKRLMGKKRDSTWAHEL